jgi:hypothetical protein
MNIVPKAAVAVSLAAVGAVGCGGHDKANAPTVRSEAPSGPHVRAAPARPRDVALIRRWADTLRAGRVTAAARLFHLPALVENGTGELALPTAAAAREFNASLPCGAELLRAKRVRGGYTIAIFRLTDRPGGGCVTGTGHQAATAFRFRNGLISEWRRVAVPTFEAPRPAPPRV